MDNNELKIGLTQLVSSRKKEENISKIEKFVKIAKNLGADMVVFPEIFMIHFTSDDSLEKRASEAESLDGNFVKNILKLSKQYNISITVGMYESIKNNLKVYNTTITTNDNGELLNVYRKTHLYDAFNFKESDFYEPSNNKYEVFDFKGFKIGIMVCYEVRFPEIARSLTLKGAEVIIIPSAWVKGYNKEEHWITLIKARALENTVYVATSNQIGNIYTGITSFVDPLGVILHRMNEDEGIIIGEVKKERLKEVRNILPVINQRRPNLYEL
ncbi:putative amidohydrolase [Caldisphaera lagunensis DSM 15908]|uniref:Putative amidohydrolase n=1 Tax=Caldisphaera lagunensis (strain DSM 15908 / JCM 11604 / ANMR 0165 / IC-154) TaxID=1056495 RepID=L0ABE5_CALLD|nr:carbon-nitrogen hydrolase family protein [Caldisphaera lagunensis]AFZ71218.1 putative amidohydrolase [Caldisphaera lagunensis DSM 15908]